MQEIESNKQAWGVIAEEHYNTFKQRFAAGQYDDFNAHIAAELPDLTGKRVIHLQCNTGADTILLARRGAAQVLGVDLVPENVAAAKRLASDLGVENVDFLACDLMQLADVHFEKYDFVFTSEGVLCWLPDLTRWAQTIRQLLHDDGEFYIFDSHPIMMLFDEGALAEGRTEIKYPYFDKLPNMEQSIGGYAATTHIGVVTYDWMHTMGDIINSLLSAGLRIHWLHEFVENYWQLEGQVPAGDGLWTYPWNTDKFPMSYSILASVDGVVA
jgi:SAM-dependent methyltransferase